MAFAFTRSFFLSFSFLLIALSSSLAPTSLSENVLVSQEHTGRNLAQAKKNCPVDFEFVNYTIITSKCKGPHYSAKECCAAFKEFACPYANLLNDLTNDCASIMFTYINLYGKYPPGLFASLCHQGKNGLKCPASSSPPPPPPPPAEDKNGV